MMPSGAGREPILGRPTVPMCIRLAHACAPWCREKKADASLALLLAHPHRPILIIHGEAWRIRASLANDVQVLAAFESIKLDPRLQRNRIAVGELKVAVRSGVFK